MTSTGQHLFGPALGDLTAGDWNDGDDLLILGRVGIAGADMPGRRTELADRLADGAVGGSQHLSARELAVPLATRSLEVLQRLTGVMGPRPNPDDTLALHMRGLGYEAPDDAPEDANVRTIWVRPERMAYQVDTEAVGGRMWRIDAAWIATDPAIYSFVEHEHRWGVGSATDGMGTTPGASFQFPATNAGMATVATGRALSLRITCHGPVVNPYIRVVDAGRSGEIVTFHRSFTSGQVIETDVRLVPRVGSQSLTGRARSGSSPFVSWPRLRPGTQTIEVGCASGAISGRFRHRDAWWA